MTRLRCFLIGCLVLAVSGTGRADAQNHRTTITVPYAVQVGQNVLQPGEYVIRMPEMSGAQNLVEILTADEKTVVATVQGVSIFRQRVTSTTEFWFWKTPRGKPRVVRAWFYPGEESGVEIVRGSH